jgi:hypothetical protein
MPAWLLWSLGALIIWAEGPLLQLASAQGWALQLAIPCVIYLGLRRSGATAALILAAWLPVAERGAGGTSGLFALGLVGVFAMCRVLEPWIDVSRWGMLHTLLCSLGALVHHAVVAGALVVTRPESVMLVAVLLTAPASLFIAPLVGLPIGFVLVRIDRWFDGRSRRAQRL